MSVCFPRRLFSSAAKAVPVVDASSAADMRALARSIRESAAAAAAAGSDASVSPGPVLIRPSTSKKTPDDALALSLFESAHSAAGWETLLSALEKVPGPGETIVPLEMGGNYLEAGERVEVPLAHFVAYLREFERMKSSRDEIPLIYLAQHQLFEQLTGPEFAIRTPELLDALQAEQAGDVDVYSVVAWLGPSGTFSPLHTDPHDNCFTQLRGTKRFRIVDPETGDKGIPREVDALQQNTIQGGAAVDTLGVEFFEVHLSPGDSLYLPQRWWHEVEAESAPSGSTSASVTHWWRLR